MAFQGMRSSNDQLQNSWPSKLFLKSQGKRLDCSLVKYDASCIWLFSAERKVSQTVSLFLGCFAATPISWFCTDQLQTTQSLLRALWEDKERSAGNGEINSLLHQVTSLSQILYLLSFTFCLLHISYLFSGKVCWKWRYQFATSPLNIPPFTTLHMFYIFHSIFFLLLSIFIFYLLSRKVCWKWRDQFATSPGNIPFTNTFKFYLLKFYPLSFIPFQERSAGNEKISSLLHLLTPLSQCLKSDNEKH